MNIFEYEVDGVLFVGDPHLSPDKPGRRLEPEHEIVHVMMGKLEEAFRIANSKNLLVVILGDLFDKARNSSDLLNTLLFTCLRNARHLPLCLAGNHDLLATEVTSDTSLAAVEATGLIRVIKTSNRIVARIKMGDKMVALGGTLHDDEILSSVVGLEGTQGADQVIWVTHHDIAFEGAYPGSLTPHAIEGCSLVVNGHMHRTQPSILAGDTWWSNPGNIFRQTIADAKHVPAVWEWNPSMDTPTRHTLTYIEDVFLWTGKQLKVQGDSSLSIDKDDPEFVTQLQASLSSEIPKTTQGDVLMEDIEAIKEELVPSEPVYDIILKLHAAVTKKS